MSVVLDRIGFFLMIAGFSAALLALAGTVAGFGVDVAFRLNYAMLPFVQAAAGFMAIGLGCALVGYVFKFASEV